MIAKDFREWLMAITDFPPTHYQHMSGKAGERLCWFLLSGSEDSSETLQRSPPDRLFLDLELYDNSLDRLQETIDSLLDQSDYRGSFGEGYIEDVAFEDQKDDYEPLADAESLPKYSVFFRVTLTGYIPK